jgi:peptide/nickel transport system substrate-binding protein
VTAEKVDDSTVRFTLREPFSPFLDYTTIGLLARHAYEALPPAEVVARFNDRPVGNGPMKVTALDANHVRLEPNLFYSTRTPYLQALELWFYPDHQSLITAEANGEIEGVSRVQPATIAGAAAHPELQLFSSVLPSYINITLNLDNPNAQFFQEKAVRQALMLGLNREELIQTVAAGQGILAHSPILPENWAYNPGVRQYAYDPAAARALLEQNGWVDTNGDGVREKNNKSLSFRLFTNDDPLRMELVYAIARQWEQIGVRALPLPSTFAGLVNDILAPRQFEAALIGWETPGDPDPYPLWHSSQAENPGQNYGSWRNEEADKIMEQARKTLREDERKALYAQFQSIFAEELPALLLYYPVYTYGVNDKVHNVQIGALNNPSERFAGFADWYMVTRRVPVGQEPPSAPPTPPGSTPAAEDQ